MNRHLLVAESGKIDTDWVRTERQRTVMEAVPKKAATHPVSDLKMLSKIAPFIDTDLSKSEIMSLAFKIIGNVSEAFSSRHAHSTEHGNTQQEAAPPS